MDQIHVVRHKVLVEGASIRKVAKEMGRSPAQVALRWVLEQPGITSTIIGARTMAQARDNLLAGSFRLGEAALARLNAVSHLPERYPASMENGMHERRNAAVKMPAWG